MRTIGTGKIADGLQRTIDGLEIGRGEGQIIYAKAFRCPPADGLIASQFG